MLPTAITNMLAVLEQPSGRRPQVDDLQRFGRALMDAPDLAAQPRGAMAGISTVSTNDQQTSQLLGTAMDEAKTAQENGQKCGAALIDALEEQLGRPVSPVSVSHAGEPST